VPFLDLKRIPRTPDPHNRPSQLPVPALPGGRIVNPKESIAAEPNNPMPAGLYFVQLQAGDRELTNRVARIP
jgi:hypothetical protein